MVEENAITTIDNAAERARREVGRPSTAEAFREVLIQKRHLFPPRVHCLTHIVQPKPTDITRLHYSFNRRIRMAPFRTTSAITVATARSGTFEPVRRTRPAAIITPRFAITSFVVKIQLAFM